MAGSPFIYSLERVKLNLIEDAEFKKRAEKFRDEDIKRLILEISAQFPGSVNHFVQNDGNGVQINEYSKTIKGQLELYEKAFQVFGVDLGPIKHQLHWSNPRKPFSGSDIVKAEYDLEEDGLEIVE